MQLDRVARKGGKEGQVDVQYRSAFFFILYCRAVVGVGEAV